MKTFTFRYQSKATPKDLFARLEKAAKTRIRDVEKDEASSNSIPAILSTMSAGRIQLFYTIADQKPESMYQLAQFLSRDPANVTRDVKVLEGLGLIELVIEKDGERERSRPVALYDRLIFDFGQARARTAPSRRGSPKKSAAS
jgi:predicted transcriptional regulator